MALLVGEGGEHGGGHAPPSRRRELAMSGRLSPPPSGVRAPACGRFQKTRRAGARGSLHSDAGGHLVLSSPDVWEKKPLVGDPAPRARGRWPGARAPHCSGDHVFAAWWPPAARPLNLKWGVTAVSCVPSPPSRTSGL